MISGHDLFEFSLPTSKFLLVLLYIYIGNIILDIYKIEKLVPF